MGKVISIISLVAAIIGTTIAYFFGGNPIEYALKIGLLAFASTLIMVVTILLLILWKGSQELIRLIFWR